MDHKELQALIEVFKTTPENSAFAELIITKLKQNESEKELKEFLLSPSLQALIDKSFLIANEKGSLHLEMEEFDKAVICFKACIEIPEISKVDKLAILYLLVPCLLASNNFGDLTKYMQQLDEEYPGVDHSNIEATLIKMGYEDNEPTEAAPKRAAEAGQLTEFKAVAKEYIGMTFEDVGGLEDLKHAARMKIIRPFQHPELFQKYGKKAGGGILLYGPPGCGKTFFSRAIAGECETDFFSIGIHDILDMWMGNSERNVHNLFEEVRSASPAILFIDEIDALGRKRELTRYSSLTGVINAFLTEMDGLHGSNENILVIGATNVPWDVDNAFKRPGRFDTLFLVPPPDETGRQEILAKQMEGRPATGIDYAYLAKHAERFSGADLAGLVEKTTEYVLDEVMESNQERDIQMDDFLKTLNNSNGTIDEWLSVAENYIEYANQNGQYDDLKAIIQGKQKTGGKRMGFF